MGRRWHAHLFDLGLPLRRGSAAAVGDPSGASDGDFADPAAHGQPPESRTRPRFATRPHPISAAMFWRSRPFRDRCPHGIGWAHWVWQRVFPQGGGNANPLETLLGYRSCHRKNMVNIAVDCQMIASVFRSLFARSICGTMARTWGWKVFRRRDFWATPGKKLQPRLFDRIFLDCLSNMVG
jgi:hypothetical protein